MTLREAHPRTNAWKNSRAPEQNTTTQHKCRPRICARGESLRMLRRHRHYARMHVYLLHRRSFAFVDMHAHVKSALGSLEAFLFRRQLASHGRKPKNKCEKLSDNMLYRDRNSSSPDIYLSKQIGRKGLMPPDTRDDAKDLCNRLEPCTYRVLKHER